MEASKEQEVWMEFDYIFDRRGEKAAILSLPYEEDAVVLYTDDMSEKERCIHCGDLPSVVTTGPYRVKRSLLGWVFGRKPFMISGGWEARFCDCWEPEGGYESSLDFL